MAKYLFCGVKISVWIKLHINEERWDGSITSKFFVLLRQKLNIHYNV